MPPIGLKSFNMAGAKNKSLKEKMKQQTENSKLKRKSLIQKAKFVSSKLKDKDRTINQTPEHKKLVKVMKKGLLFQIFIPKMQVIIFISLLLSEFFQFFF